jgi:hypothetical protein
MATSCVARGVLMGKAFTGCTTFIGADELGAQARI